jgi:hypothetical protein
MLLRLRFQAKDIYDGSKKLIDIKTKVEIVVPCKDSLAFYLYNYCSIL